MAALPLLLAIKLLAVMEEAGPQLLQRHDNLARLLTEFIQLGDDRSTTHQAVATAAAAALEAVYERALVPVHMEGLQTLVLCGEYRRASAAFRESCRNSFAFAAARANDVMHLAKLMGTTVASAEHGQQLASVEVVQACATAVNDLLKSQPHQANDTILERTVFTESLLSTLTTGDVEKLTCTLEDIRRRCTQPIKAVRKSPSGMPRSPTSADLPREGSSRGTARRNNSSSASSLRSGSERLPPIVST
eukprot:gnl/TRDRNA2_/TRDRNA2_161630_c2_seq1.p1 gnl/TRDRNA2_/TRDRNA2_161630_c2~~gnl/TRDRNA2_/TRDRNA2_161630_c2_seq1.p1  ORF type:complete len:276 (-),score=54.42 gnl/TRDRNA2_/TRDRNA2_161630_c2_seq1:40-783(-)